MIIVCKYMYVDFFLNCNLKDSLKQYEIGTQPGFPLKIQQMFPACCFRERFVGCYDTDFSFLLKQFTANLKRKSGQFQLQRKKSC